MNEQTMLEEMGKDTERCFVDPSSQLYITPEQFKMFRQRTFNAKSFQNILTENTTREGLEGAPYCYSTSDLFQMYKSLNQTNKASAF